MQRRFQLLFGLRFFFLMLIARAFRSREWKSMKLFSHMETSSSDNYADAQAPRVVSISRLLRSSSSSPVDLGRCSRLLHRHSRAEKVCPSGTFSKFLCNPQCYQFPLDSLTIRYTKSNFEMREATQKAWKLNAFRLFIAGRSNTDARSQQAYSVSWIVFLFLASHLPRLQFFSYRKAQKKSKQFDPRAAQIIQLSRGRREAKCKSNAINYFSIFIISQINLLAIERWMNSVVRLMMERTVEWSFVSRIFANLLSCAELWWFFNETGFFRWLNCWLQLRCCIKFIFDYSLALAGFYYTHQATRVVCWRWLNQYTPRVRWCNPPCCRPKDELRAYVTRCSTKLQY